MDFTCWVEAAFPQRRKTWQTELSTWWIAMLIDQCRPPHPTSPEAQPPCLPFLNKAATAVAWTAGSETSGKVRAAGVGGRVEEATSNIQCKRLHFYKCNSSDLHSSQPLPPQDFIERSIWSCWYTLCYLGNWWLIVEVLRQLGPVGHENRK